MLGAKLGEVVLWVAGMLQSVFTSSLAILNVFSLVVVMPIVVFFLLRDWEKIVAQIDAHLPRQSLDTIRGQARAVSETLVGFIHGQALVCLILAVYYGIALSIAGIGSALALGILIGVLAIIPFLGVTTGFLLAVSLAASQYGTWTAILWVVGIFAFGQLVEGNVLNSEAGGRPHSFAPALGHVCAIRRRHLVRLCRNFDRRAGGGGDRRLGAFRARPLPAKHAV